MPLLAKASSTNYTPPPAGTHAARCCWVIDLGHQYQDLYKKEVHQILLGWELPEEKREDGAPHVISKRYTLSIHEKSKLTADLVAWRTRPFTPEELQGFSVEKLLGVPCLLTVSHVTKTDGGKRAKVVSVSAAPKAMSVAPAITKPVYYEVEQGKGGVFPELPEWLQTLISGCQEFKAAPPSVDNEPDNKDDVPF